MLTYVFFLYFLCFFFYTTWFSRKPPRSRNSHLVFDYGTRKHLYLLHLVVQLLVQFADLLLVLLPLLLRNADHDGGGVVVQNGAFVWCFETCHVLRLSSLGLRHILSCGDGEADYKRCLRQCRAMPGSCVSPFLQRLSSASSFWMVSFIVLFFSFSFSYFLFHCSAVSSRLMEAVFLIVLALWWRRHRGELTLNLVQ